MFACSCKISYVIDIDDYNIVITSNCTYDSDFPSDSLRF